MKRARLLILLSLLIPVAVAGCDDMTDQPRQKTYAPAPSPPPRPAGVVQYKETPTPPPKLTMALMRRGQLEFRIYCTPCHSELGNGNGMIVQRGFPHPPDYTNAKLMAAPPMLFYKTITNGFGVMYSFADRVKPTDRWAITAYIHALQKARTATVADLTPDERALLK